jgi:hypothetical protein
MCAAAIRAFDPTVVLPLASALPGHALAGPSTAPHSSGSGRYLVRPEAFEVALLVENCPGDAGKLVGDSLFIVRAMRQERITVPVIGGSAGYVIPDFEKALGEFAEAVFSISPTNYDLAPALTDKFRKRFGYFMAHEAIEQAVALDVELLRKLSQGSIALQGRKRHLRLKGWCVVSARSSVHGLS